MAIQLLISAKKSVSAKELQRQPGHKNCNPVWAMPHKLRDVMGKRDSQHELDGTIGRDEYFFTTEIPEKEKDKPLKRERSGQGKAPVTVMAETTPGNDVNPKYGHKPEAVRHVKMLVVDSLRLWTPIRKSRRMSP